MAALFRIVEDEHPPFPDLVLAMFNNNNNNSTNDTNMADGSAGAGASASSSNNNTNNNGLLLVPPSDGLLDFLRQCLRKEPTRRPGANELLRHPWVSIAR